MNIVERRARHNSLYRFISRHTSSFWGASFIDALESETMSVQVRSFSLLHTLLCNLKAIMLQVEKNIEFDNITHCSFVAQMLIDSVVPVKHVLKSYVQNNRKRLIVLNYDGVLVSHQANPSLAKPPRLVLDRLRQLSSHEHNIVVVLSGRTREEMSDFIDIDSVGLLAEHGYFYSPPISNSSNNNNQVEKDSCANAPSDVRKREWKNMYSDTDCSWIQAVTPIFDFFTERTQGSSIEPKETHLTWHYR